MSPLSVHSLGSSGLTSAAAEGDAPRVFDGDGTGDFFQLLREPVGGAPGMGQQGEVCESCVDSDVRGSPSEVQAFGEEPDVGSRLDGGRTLEIGDDNDGDDASGEEIAIDDIAWYSADDLHPAAADRAESPEFTQIHRETEGQPAPIVDRIIRRLEQAGTFSRDAGGNLTFGLAFGVGPLAGIRLEISAPGEGRVAVRARSVRPATPSQRECLSDLVDRLEARGLCVERVGF